MIALSQRVAQIALTIVLMFGFGLPVVAQQEIPQVISYQGFLRDGAGAPVTGTVTLTMKLYDAMDGGTESWSETHTGVSVTDGVFNVALGSITAFSATDLVFDKALFLGITVNTDAEMAPRLPLTTGPYAFTAKVGFFNAFVDCTAQQAGERPIRDALVKAPTGGVLTITLNGICEERVSLGRDLVRFVAATPPATPVKDGGIPTDGVRGNIDNDGALRVRGASDIAAYNIVLESAAGGTERYGVIVQKNGSLYLENVLLRNSYAGALVNRGGFLHLRQAQVADNTNYGILVTDAGLLRMGNSNIIFNKSDSGDGEAAIGGYRQVNIRLRGGNQVINAGDDGLFDAVNPDATVNDDNGLAVDIYHNGSFRQDGGHTVFVGRTGAGNNTTISLRDPQHVGDISIGSSAVMDLRDSSTSEPELMARTVLVNDNSLLSFGRDNMELTVTGLTRARNRSRIGIYRDSIVSHFGRIVVEGTSEMTAYGQITVNDNINVWNNSEFNKWNAPGFLNADSFQVNDGSSMRIRGPATIANASWLGLRSTLDLRDTDPSSAVNDTLMTIGGNLNVNNYSELQVNNSARIEVAGTMYFGPNSGLDVTFGSIASSEILSAGPFANIFVSDGSALNVGTPVGDVTTLGELNLNRVQFTLAVNASATGHLRAGGYTSVNMGGPNAEHHGDIEIFSGRSGGVMHLQANFTVHDGSINCHGPALDSPDATVNTSGHTVTFAGTSPGTFINCGPP